MKILNLTLAVATATLTLWLAPASASAKGCLEESQAFSNAGVSEKKAAFSAFHRCLRELPHDRLPNFAYNTLFDYLGPSSEEWIRKEVFIDISMLKVCGQKEVDLFKQTLQNNPSESYRELATGGIMLCRSAIKSNAPSLIAAFNSEPIPKLKNRIIQSLGAIENQEPATISFLTQVAKADSCGPCRRSAGMILTRWKQSFDQNELDRILLSSPDTTNDMARLIEVVRSSGADVEADVFSIQDSHKPVNTDRELALRALGTPKVIAPLQEQYRRLLKDPNPSLRDVAAFVLGKAGDKSAIPGIRKNLDMMGRGNWDEPSHVAPDFFRFGISASALLSMNDCASLPLIMSFPPYSRGWSFTLTPCKQEAKPLLQSMMKSKKPNQVQAAKETYRRMYYEDPE